MRLLLIIILVAVGGCQLAPLDVTGLKCTETRKCGDGFFCQGGHCIRSDGEAGFDGGASIPRGVNLAINPGFELESDDGGVEGWFAALGRIRSESSAAHSGLRGGHLTAANSGQSAILRPSLGVSGTHTGMLFCASLWVRSESDAGVEFALTIRELFADGGAAPSGGTRLVVKNEWTLVKEEHVSFGESVIEMRVTTPSTFDAGTGFYVDDAWFSLAAESTCP